MECNEKKLNLEYVEETDYNNYSNVLLVAVDTLKADSYIDENVHDKTIRVAAEYVQDTIIERVIGTCLYDMLRHLICECMIEHPDYWHYKELLEDYIVPIFIWAVPAEISIPLSFKERNVGVYQVKTDGIDNTSLNDIKYLNQYYRNKADFYIKRAMDYICCHYRHFPELCNCSCGSCCGCRKLWGTKKYSTPLNLRTTNIYRWFRPLNSYH